MRKSLALGQAFDQIKRFEEQSWCFVMSEFLPNARAWNL